MSIKFVYAVTPMEYVIPVVGSDAKRPTAYYVEIQKKIADYIKRLLGRRPNRLTGDRVS